MRKHATNMKYTKNTQMNTQTNKTKTVKCDCLPVYQIDPSIDKFQK